VKRVGFLTTAALVCTALVAAIPAIAATPQEQVRQLVSKFADHKDEGSIAQAVDTSIDFPTIVSRAFQPSEWQSFAPDQKKQLIDAFRKYIGARYYMRWHRIFENSQLSLGDSARSADGVFVRTTIQHGHQQDSVTWTLNGSNQVVDLDVNDKGLIARLAETAQPQLHKQGPAQFVAWMNQQALTAQKRANEATANASERKPI
jgi:ABC-type transporter MlaC component